MAAETLILSMIQKMETWETWETGGSCMSFCMMILCYIGDGKIEMESKVIDELRMIVDILRDKKLGEGKRLHYFICDLVEMAHDALDLYPSNRSYLISTETSSIQSWIREIKMRLLKFGDDGTETESDVRSENVGEDEYVVGLEEDVELLLGTKIFNKREYLSTFLIKGMAGLGKTTLARQLYNHASVIGRFERRAWVCVSRELTHKEVLMKLMQQVVDSEQLQKDSLLDKMESADNRSLRQMLHQRLQGMRYFIVLDDLPEQMRLESILKALPNEGRGSRLLVTCCTSTRYIQAFPHYIHEMEPLGFDQSWKLFLKAIPHEFPKQMEKMGRDMLTKCSGVPLAIKQVARQFAEKRQSGSEWEQLVQPTHFYEILEALILPVIHKNEEVANDLRMVVGLVRDKGLREGTSLYFMICDLVDMAQDLVKNSECIKSWSRVIKLRMLDLGVDGAETTPPMRLENDEDEDVVGLKEDVDLVLRRGIFNEEKYFSISMVTGMVGIGKTALARQVYNHSGVIGQFDRRAWICVSSDFSHRQVLIKLIQQVVDSDQLQKDSLLEILERPDNFSPRQMLHKHLKGMRYFIVLDDLPKEMCFEYILKALPHEDNGSRLLLTSPSQNIRASINYTHLMKTLDSDKSWLLFSKTISCGNKFTSELKFPKHLESRGRELLKECGGLPLAIKHVGRQFAEKRRSGTEWEQLLQSIDLNAILELLELSYQKLDQELKSCFLHLALFKENTSFRIKKLEQMCAAGGTFSGSYLQIRLCVSSLTMESMIEMMDTNVYGNIRTFRINVLLHSLSKRKAEEEIDLEILRNNGNNRPSQNPRHRIIICRREKFDYLNHGNKHLVSLFFHGGGYLEASPSYWNSFEQLKILDLEDFGIKILPESIGTLIELRYLGLRNNYLQELPHSLGWLKKLEVLDIAQNFMVEVPEIIWEMGSLIHLNMSDVICRMPLKIDALKNLMVLTYISVDNWIYELSDLQMLAFLYKLGIEELDGNSDVSKLFASLAKLERLYHVNLRGYRIRSMPCLDELGVLQSVYTLKLDGRLDRLPNSFPPWMSSLTLVNSSLDEDPMPLLLLKLPNLISLKLRNAYTGQQMVILSHGFPMLKHLFIEELSNLRNVQVGEGAMQRLKHLEVKNCPNMETLTDLIGSMTHLQALTIVTTKNIATKFRKSTLISKINLVEIKP